MIHFYSSTSSYTQGSTIVYLTLNSDSSLASTLADYTIGSQYTAETKDLSRENIITRLLEGNVMED